MATLYVDPQSPYAYLAEARAERVLGFRPDLQPVALGVIFRRRGWDSWAHMDSREEHVRAVEARAVAAGLPPVRWPATWPAPTLAPARTSLWAHEQGAGRRWLRSYWSLVFAAGRAPEDTATLAAASADCGLDPEEAAHAIERAGLKDRLRSVTDAAWTAGVRGIPTLAAGGRLFYGDDRLEAAAAVMARCAPEPSHQPANRRPPAPARSSSEES